MIKKQSQISLRLICGALVLISAITSIRTLPNTFSLFSFGSFGLVVQAISNLLEFSGILLLFFALFFQRPNLNIGLCLTLISSVLNLLCNVFVRYAGSLYMLSVIFSAFLTLIYWTFLFISIQTKKSSSAYISIGARIIQFLIFLIQINFQLSFISLLYVALDVAIAFTLGAYAPYHKSAKATIITSTVQTSTSATADNIIKLKEMVDSGIITQEEFDAKKKQLLGL